MAAPHFTFDDPAWRVADQSAASKPSVLLRQLRPKP